tara:strand:+ start:2048 stop:3679 length:1632 start_codon:yes stop_codon:yes gene_type:complete
VKKARPLDVLIIGAGVNGAGVFRDLCVQGLKCAIIDKSDFGSGTSAASSRLIHGGLKYLETGELRLVAESTLERNLLLSNAPHLVKPLKTVIPMFSWLKGIRAALRTLMGSTTAPRSRGAILIKIGLAMYDFYGRHHRVMPKHNFWLKSRAMQELPALNKKAVAVGIYFDAMITAPERMVMELVQDGLQLQQDSIALTYAKVDAVCGSDVVAIDENGETHEFSPKIVVNAAGPWIDHVNESLGISEKLISGTKGSHIIVDNPQLVTILDGRMIYYEANDGRICLVYGYLGKVLVGSTDSRATDPDSVICEEEEIDYFLESLAYILPDIAVTRKQIIFAYSGIRPLPASDRSAVGLISRNHSVSVLESDNTRNFPIISLIGGKWTTFRSFSEEVADLILNRLNASRLASTKELAIGGGLNYPKNSDLWSSSFAEPERAKILLSRYGMTALEILKAESNNPRMLINTPSYSEQEINWIVEHEQVAHLSDLIIRRTHLAICGLLNAAGLFEIAEITGQTLKWDSVRISHEITTTRKLLLERHHQLL